MEKYGVFKGAYMIKFYKYLSLLVVTLIMLNLSGSAYSAAIIQLNNDIFKDFLIKNSQDILNNYNTQLNSFSNDLDDSLEQAYDKFYQNDFLGAIADCSIIIEKNSKDMSVMINVLIKIIMVVGFINIPNTTHKAAIPPYSDI